MNANDIFTDTVLQELFPAQRTNDFFEALFGDADEGAYDIKLSFAGHDSADKCLNFTLDLHERSGCCLVCNLTLGLPEVFSRHPIINLNGLISDIESKMDGQAQCTDWQLGTTSHVSSDLHSIPLRVNLG